MFVFFQHFFVPPPFPDVTESLFFKGGLEMKFIPGHVTVLAKFFSGPFFRDLSFWPVFAFTSCGVSRVPLPLFLLTSALQLAGFFPPLALATKIPVFLQPWSYIPVVWLLAGVFDGLGRALPEVFCHCFLCVPYQPIGFRT